MHIIYVITLSRIQSPYFSVCSPLPLVESSLAHPHPRRFDALALARCGQATTLMAAPLSRVRFLTLALLLSSKRLRSLPDADKRLRSSPIVESSAGSPYEISHLTVAEVLEY